MLTAATKPDKMRSEEGPSYWAINENDKHIFGRNVETDDSSFEKFDNDEKQINEAITKNNWVKEKI